MMDTYSAFIARKSRQDVPRGIADPADLPSAMFPFQRDIVRWALRRGRAAIFAGTGLGKTLMELAWARAVCDATGGDVLMLTPLAVGVQVPPEGAKFGVDARHWQAGGHHPGIIVANYEKFHLFDMSRFAGVVLDESSILKNFDGSTRNALVSGCASVPFRLAASATPAPNDFAELGNHADFLGIMSMHGMLSTFFVHDSGDTGTWRLKGHAEDDFWRWMCSWAVMLRRPSDLGYSDAGYDLPPLYQTEHIVPIGGAEARSLSERIAARRDSVEVRVAEAVKWTPLDRPSVWWCNLNAESERLAAAIPGAVELRGSDSEAVKERKLLDFAGGGIRTLITKPSICGFGMNWQHCADTGFVGLNDSFEQIYQAVRRFWRFGQTRPVYARFIAARTEGAVLANIRRKEADADRMAWAMVRHMADLSRDAISAASLQRDGYAPAMPVNVPWWLRGDAA